MPDFFIHKCEKCGNEFQWVVGKTQPVCVKCTLEELDKENSAKMRDVLEQADEYLNVSPAQKATKASNYIGTGSILHKMMKDALGRPDNTMRTSQEDRNCMLCGADVQGRFLFCDDDCQRRFEYFTNTKFGSGHD